MTPTPDTTGLREHRRGDVAEVEGRRAVYIPTRWDWMDGTWTTIPLSVGPVLGNLYDLAAHPDPTPEPDAGDVEALAEVLAAHEGCIANPGQDNSGSGSTGVDVWSCGLRVPFVDDLDTMTRLHLAHAFAAHDAEVRRETGERAWQQGYTSGHSNAMRRMSDEPNAPATPNPYAREEASRG